MEWVVIAVLSGTIIILYRLYNISDTACRGLYSKLIQVLIDENNYKCEREKLLELINNSSCASSGELATTVFQTVSTSALGYKSKFGSMFNCQEELWSVYRKT